uniref:Uncharacterized protein n=1 Tax=Romanomermis culicivorax TaxID=13658 RepID=A0A915KDD7_ROMCU
MWFNKDVNEKLRVKWWSAPGDIRFPQTCQTRHCYQYYVDYFRCKNFKGENYEPCDYFKAVYLCMCPASW